MTELEKFYAFLPFDMNDPEVSSLKAQSRERCYKYNNSQEGNQQKRLEILKELLGTAEDDMFIKPPFYSDYGINIHVGKNFFCNFDTVMLDLAEIRFGDNVLIGPQCGFYTAIHPMNVEERKKGDSLWKTDNCWK